jgi:hypothetical protein
MATQRAPFSELQSEHGMVLLSKCIDPGQPEAQRVTGQCVQKLMSYSFAAAAFSSMGRKHIQLGDHASVAERKVC